MSARSRAIKLSRRIDPDAVNGGFLCGNDQAFRQFKTDIEALFEERRDEIRRHQQDVIDRIAEDGLHG